MASFNHLENSLNSINPPSYNYSYEIEFRETAELLKKWNLVELIPDFYNKRILKNFFTLLTTDDINYIIPDYKLQYRSQFYVELEKYKFEKQKEQEALASYRQLLDTETKNGNSIIQLDVNYPSTYRMIGRQRPRSFKIFLFFILMMIFLFLYFLILAPLLRMHHIILDDDYSSTDGYYYYTENSRYVW